MERKLDFWPWNKKFIVQVPTGKIASVEDDTNTTEIHRILKHITYFAWLIGVFPVHPKNIKKCVETPKKGICFIFYCLLVGLVMLFYIAVKSMVLIQVSQTHYSSMSDKLNYYLAEIAAWISDAGIRCGFFLRYGESVLLFQGIYVYRKEFGFQGTYRHRLLRIWSMMILNFVYFTWCTGIVLRKMKVTRRTEESWRNMTVTFFPGAREEGNLEIADVLGHFSTVLSSYYLMYLIISISWILLEFLTEFKIKLKDDLARAQRHFEKMEELCYTTNNSRRGSSVASRDFQLYPPRDPLLERLGGPRGTLNHDPITGASQSSSLAKLDFFTDLDRKMGVSHRQFSALRSLFSRFNHAIGFSMVLSIGADIMMIISVTYGVISKFVDSNIDSSDLKGGQRYADIFVAFSEAEYEARVVIVAVIGSYMAYKLRTYKVELEEIFYGTEKNMQLLATIPGSLYKRFLAWEWSLRGLDMFILDLRLVPLIIGTVTTYVIVMLQLKMSDRTETLLKQ